MSCRVVYDIAGTFWTDPGVRRWAAAAIAGMLLLLWMLFVRLYALPRGSSLRRPTWSVLAAIGFGTVILCPIAVLFLHHQFAGAVAAYRSGEYATLSGPIQRFRDENEGPIEPGMLTVEGHTFFWDPLGAIVRYPATSPRLRRHAPSVYGSVLHRDMLVRIRYAGDRIFRIETLAAELPDDDAVRLPSCAAMY